MKTIRLLNLHCSKTDEDTNNTKLNKTFLTVDNGRFHIFGPESLMHGSDWNVNADVQINEQAKIGFFDEDLVRNLVPPNTLGITLLRKIIIFMMDQKRLVLLLKMQIMY